MQLREVDVQSRVAAQVFAGCDLCQLSRLVFVSDRQDTCCMVCPVGGRGIRTDYL